MGVILLLVLLLGTVAVTSVVVLFYFSPHAAWICRRIVQRRFLSFRLWLLNRLRASSSHLASSVSKKQMRTRKKYGNSRRGRMNPEYEDDDETEDEMDEEEEDENEDHDHDGDEEKEEDGGRGGFGGGEEEARVEEVQIEVTCTAGNKGKEPHCSYESPRGVLTSFEAVETNTKHSNLSLVAAEEFRPCRVERENHGRTSVEQTDFEMGSLSLNRRSSSRRRRRVRFAEEELVEPLDRPPDTVLLPVSGVRRKKRFKATRTLSVEQMELLSNHVDVLFRNGSIDEAQRQYDRALKKFPDTPGLHGAVAHFLLSVEEWTHNDNPILQRPTRSCGDQTDPKSIAPSLESLQSLSISYRHFLDCPSRSSCRFSLSDTRFREIFHHLHAELGIVSECGGSEEISCAYRDFASFIHTHGESPSLYSLCSSLYEESISTSRSCFSRSLSGFSYAMFLHEVIRDEEASRDVLIHIVDELSNQNAVIPSVLNFQLRRPRTLLSQILSVLALVFFQLGNRDLCREYLEKSTSLAEDEIDPVSLYIFSIFLRHHGDDLSDRSKSEKFRHASKRRCEEFAIEFKDDVEDSLRFASIPEFGYFPSYSVLSRKNSSEIPPPSDNVETDPKDDCMTGESALCSVVAIPTDSRQEES